MTRAGPAVIMNHCRAFFAQSEHKRSAIVFGPAGFRKHDLYEAPINQSLNPGKTRCKSNIVLIRIRQSDEADGFVQFFPEYLQMHLQLTNTEYQLPRTLLIGLLNCALFTGLGCSRDSSMDRANQSPRNNDAVRDDAAPKSQESEPETILDVGPGDDDLAVSTEPRGELTEVQSELMALAFDAATLVPVDPHLRDRSRYQSQVLDVYLELDQPDEVMSRVSAIENWRQAECLGKLALYQAMHQGRPDRAVEVLAQVQDLEYEDLAKWRQDRIDLQVARTLAWLGEDEMASRIEAGLQPSEQGRISPVRVRRMAPEELPGLFESLDAFAENPNFDGAIIANEIFIALHARFFADPSVRRRVEDQVMSLSIAAKLPLNLLMQACFELADECIRQGDLGGARRILDQCRERFDLYNSEVAPWSPEYKIPMLGELARRYAQVGEGDLARNLVLQGKALYDSDKRTIGGLFRADALRPLAEAVLAYGSDQEADEMYRLVLETGLENPNARPRAEDLMLTCISMARFGYQPGETEWALIRQGSNRLGAPW